MTKSRTLLEGCRVLDLTDEKGHICGKVLGDFGADVIKIERPGGDPARNRGPFFKNVADPGKSLPWLATNTSKRGITLNIESPQGKELFLRLVKTADIVVESFEPGYLSGLGLGYSDLRAIKPDIIMTSITPFGQTGPYAHYSATDLTACAMGGLVRVLGDLGRPPVRMSCDAQAYYHAGLHAAVGSVMAFYHRELTGEGQYVDVSMQAAILLAIQHAPEIWELMKVNVVGTGQFFISVRPQPHGILFSRMIMPCKDGYVACTFGGGASLGQVISSKALVDWANEEGMALELKDYDFNQWDGATITQQEQDHIYGIIGEFLKTHTKAELYEGAVKRSIMMAPCNTIEDIMSNAQLEFRGFWEQVPHPQLGETITFPGAPLKMEESPWRIGRPAPAIGEHNREVFADEVGLSERELGLLKANGVI